MDNTADAYVAQKVTEALEARSMSLSALSEAAHIPFSTLQRKVNAGVGGFTVTEVARIAEALGVSAKSLIEPAVTEAIS